ncbi:hypothetical protein [Sphingosinicella sp. BN140058]|uniref:hypothetical protein n=1 Tax=Sphingosinicella sp. BN140058 TaxID=1892855 RepID=UPI0013ED966F|nr:hypothetical protein [Sphingosinicella sp. BN140058]
MNEISSPRALRQPTATDRLVAVALSGVFLIATADKYAGWQLFRGYADQVSTAALLAVPIVLVLRRLYRANGA